MRSRSPLRALALLLCAAGALAAGPAEGAANPGAGPDSESDPLALIQRMFPEATRIGDKDDSGSIPAWPVYQVTQVIGYAYESLDLLEFPGFSGEPMNFLIGIDNDGTLRGVDVLYHHEPIFINGLGPRAFLDFLDQYPGHSIAEQIVVGGTRGALDNDVTYFDGVTAATVTLVVANDTVLLSAMQLARERLDAFAQPAPARVRETHFESLSWDDLLQRGLVQRWSLHRDEVEEALGSRLTNYDDPDLRLSRGDHITLYYAYLNPPSVGRNLLGDAGYALLRDKLAAGEHAFAVFSDGFYRYLPEDFTPASTPDRIALLQNGLPVGLRDTNFVDVFALHLVDGAPGAKDLRIFSRPSPGGAGPESGHRTPAYGGAAQKSPGDGLRDVSRAPIPPARVVFRARRRGDPRGPTLHPGARMGVSPGANRPDSGRAGNTLDGVCPAQASRRERPRPALLSRCVSRFYPAVHRYLRSGPALRRQHLRYSVGSA